MAVEDLLSGDIGVAPSKNKFLGVTDDFVPPTIQERIPGSVATPFVQQEPFKLYRENDVYLPPIGKSDDVIAEMQQDLLDAGLIKKGVKFRIGAWDDVTASAYRKALEFANQQGLKAGEAIDTLIQSPEYDTSEAKTLQYQLPDRNDIKAIASKVSRTTLGRSLDPDSQEAIAQAYEEKLMAIQQQNFQQQAIDGAKLYEAPSSDAFAEEQIRAQNPGEAAAHDYSDQYSAFSDLLSSSASSVKSY